MYKKFLDSGSLLHKHMEKHALSSQPRSHSSLGTILLLITTILWGTTFVITSQVTQIVPPMFYMGVRYLVGVIMFLPFIGRLRKLTKKHWKHAIIAGMLCWASFAFQTYGIMLTTATKSAFITGLNVIMVPIFVALIFHRKVGNKIWVATGLALLGVFVMSFSGLEGGFEWGDLLVLICDVFYAFYIIYLERHLKEIDPIGMAFIVVLVISVLSFLLSGLVEDYSMIFGVSRSQIFTWTHLVIILYMGIFATTIANITQTFGQKYISSTRTAIIFASEPLFAAFFAIVFGPDILTWQITVGGALILAGTLASTLKKKSIDIA
jgi:drug/metabolite transporter (DMT)-like permease